MKKLYGYMIILIFSYSLCLFGGAQRTTEKIKFFKIEDYDQLDGATKQKLHEYKRQLKAMKVINAKLDKEKAELKKRFIDDSRKEQDFLKRWVLLDDHLNKLNQLDIADEHEAICEQVGDLFAEIDSRGFIVQPLKPGVENHFYRYFYPY